MVGQSVEDIMDAVLDELDAKNIESIARIQLKVLLDRLAKMDLTMEEIRRASTKRAPIWIG